MPELDNDSLANEWKIIEEDSRRERIYRLSNAGFVLENGVYVRKPFDLLGLVENCLEFYTPIGIKNVRISEEVALELPRLSSPRHISQALRPGWATFTSIDLDRCMGKPTIYRNDQVFEQQSSLGPFVTRQDDFLYLLIIAHLDEDVQRIIKENGVKEGGGFRSFERTLNHRYSQKFPGLESI